VPVFAVVKEQEIEPPIEENSKMLGIADFREKFFCGPLYLSDDDRTLYKFFGNRNFLSPSKVMGALFNPLKALRDVQDMNSRFKQKGIEGNLVGDGLKAGGVLCIASDGTLIHAFHEDIGYGISPEARGHIVEAVRSIGTQKSQ
jgi:hypothetical protein